MDSTTRDDDIEPEYDFSQGEQGKFYYPDTVLHIPIYLDDWSEAEWLLAAAHNPAFDFLKDAAEDMYSPTDGISLHDRASGDADTLRY